MVSTVVVDGGVGNMVEARRLSHWEVRTAKEGQFDGICLGRMQLEVDWQQN